MRPGGGSEEAPAGSEAADWFGQAFRLQMCGKQIGSKGAKNMLIGACVLLLMSHAHARQPVP